MAHIWTVTGPLDSEDMGLTTTHEHLLWDQSCYHCDDPMEFGIEDLHVIRQRIHAFRRNCIQSDEMEASEEAAAFYEAGGRTLIDVTVPGIGRDPKALRRIAQATGMNVVMGTGLYTAPSHPQWAQSMDESELCDVFVRELTEGVDGVRAGVIGEIGISDEYQRELVALRAAGRAQAATGAAIVIHPPGIKKAAPDMLKLLEHEGADISKVVVGHCDWFWDEIDYLADICARGANVCFDTFGLEVTLSHSLASPGDGARIAAIRKLRNRGYIDAIVTGQDICFRSQYLHLGGNGYGHTLTNIRPTLLNNGLSQAEIDALFIDNPKRIFCS